MIILDMNQISIASLMMHLNMTKADTVDENVVRHTWYGYLLRFPSLVLSYPYGEVLTAELPLWLEES